MLSEKKLKEISDCVEAYGRDYACEKFNLSKETLNRYLRNLNNSPKFERSETENEIHLNSLSHNIKTIDDLIKFAEIDLSKWKVIKITTNTWGNSNNPCYQIKAWLSPKNDDIDIDDTIKYIIDEIKDFFPSSVIKRDDLNDSCLLELALVDHHFGQMSWGKETGHGNYDINIAQKLYHDAVDYIIKSTSSFNFNKILYVVGHDFFNVNNHLNTTAGGTPQDEDCRWQKSFNKGCEIHIKTIEKLKHIADVDVLIIQGNHDNERAFYLGAMLQGRFYNDKNVKVDNEPTERKYYKYGKNLIGLTHGYKIKYDRLFGLMPIEAKHLWGDCKYYEWHIGHVHHENKKILNLNTEESQIRLRTLPTLTATDAWHAKSGFLSIRETQAFVWHPEKGNTAQFNYKP